MVTKVDLRQASFIYKNEDKKMVEIIFWATDETDILEKGQMFEQIYMGKMSGSIFGWTDDAGLEYYR